MKRSVLVFLCIALLALSLPAVSSGQDNLRIASGVVGSMNYALATGMSAVYQNHTGQTLEVLTKELTATVPELYAGRYEIASQVNAAAYIFYNSIDPRTLERTDNKKRPAIRLLMLGSATPMGFLAYNSAGMSKASELRGKRVTLKFGHFSVQLMAKANLIAAGLTEDDITVVQASNIPKGAELLNSGTVDACYGSITVPAFRELDAAKGGVRFLTYEPTPEIRQKVRDFYPGAVFLEVAPDPGLVGIPEPMTLLGTNNSLISATNVPDDIIYKFVKTIYENRAELIPYSQDFVAWQNEPPVSLYAAAPYHPGAIRYYKENGLWTDEIEAWNPQLLDLYDDYPQTGGRPGAAAGTGFRAREGRSPAAGDVPPRKLNGIGLGRFRYFLKSQGGCMFNPSERLTASVSTEEMERRWKLARQAMAEKGVDILVFRNLEQYLGGYIQWFTDIPARHTYPLMALFPKDDEMTLVAQGPFPPGATYPPSYALRGVKETLNSPYLESINWSMRYESELALSVLKKTPRATIGWVGMPHIPALLYNAFVKELPEAKFVDMTDEIDWFKAVKSQEEQELCRRCAEMQDKVWDYLKSKIEPGMCESDIYTHAHYMGTKLASERGLILVGSAPKGKPARFKYRRYQNRVIQDGDQISVLVELNGPGGMYTEIARPFSIGKPGQQQVDAFELAKEAQQLVISMCKPGADTAEIHNASNEFLVKRGSKPENRICLHGQGYDLVERPMFQNGEPMKLAEGMNITLHPSGHYDYTWATVCDNYIVGKNGPGECLHKTPKEIVVL